MKYSDQVMQTVTGLVVPASDRLSYQQAAVQDQTDSEEVEADPGAYQADLKVIVRELQKFSGKNFSKIYFERNYQGAVSRKTGSTTELYIDYATLKKPASYLALVIAHEWGHLVMGHHFSSDIPVYEKERQADFYAGIVLGVFEYNINEVLSLILKMPEQQDPVHGTCFGRACTVYQGYLQGKDLREGKQISMLWPIEFSSYEQIEVTGVKSSITQ